MKHQAMHAVILTDEAIVIASSVAGVAQQMMREVMEMPADLPIAAGFRRYLQQ